MLNTQCLCGQMKNPNAKQCKPCANETRRQKLKGVRHGAERRQHISEGKRQQIATDGKVFNLAAFMLDKPHPFAKPTGTERVVKDGRMQVKCADGKWRYRSRLVWEAANGSLESSQLIHHRNENPLDDRLENLQMVTRAEHARIHSTSDVARSRQRLTVAARKRNGTYGGS